MASTNKVSGSSTAATLFPLSGPYLIPYVKEKITYIKKKYPDTEVIAGGGVRSIETANMYRSLGADHISVSTLCFNPIMFGYFYAMYPGKTC